MIQKQEQENPKERRGLFMILLGVSILLNRSTAQSQNTTFNGKSVSSVSKSQLQQWTSQGKTFITAVSGLNIPTSGVDYPLLLIVNFSTNTRTVWLWENTIGATSLKNIDFKYWRNPVVTSSGTINPIYDTLHYFSTTTQMQAFTAPTVSNNGVLVDSFIIPGSGSADRKINFSKVLLPGTSLLVTGNSGSSNSPVDISYIWVEN